MCKNLKNFSLKRKNTSSYLMKLKKIINQIKSRTIELNKIILDQRIKNERIDISLPGRRLENGVMHPINHSINHIKKFFSKLGFESINGFEIEDEYHNFDALNISKNHPSRDDHDTFWFDRNRLLRTQTSSMQIRIMKKKNLLLGLFFLEKYIEMIMMQHIHLCFIKLKV